jgi:Tol biopolymer transport system component
VLADVYVRAARAIRGSNISREERRQTGPSVTALRHQLREADEALFGALNEQVVPDASHAQRTPGFSPAGAPLVEIKPRQWRRVAAAPRGSRTAAAAALLLSLALGYYSTVHLRRPAATVQPQAAALPAAAIAAPVSPAVVQGRERRLTSTPSVSAVHGQPRVDSPVPPLASTPLGTLLVSAARRSPDAHSAVQSSDFSGRDLEVMTIADDGARNYNVQASPDGAFVAFDSDRDGERGVYLATRSGTGVHRISGIGQAAAPTWSPDAKTVALVRAETDRPHVWNLWLLDIENGAMQRLTAFRTGETSRAAWFADGRRLCYSHDDRIVVHDLLAATTATYDSPVPGRLASNPAVSPDGRHVIFQVEGRGAWLLDLRDGSTRCILDDPTAEAFTWSADGRRAAYYSRRDDGWGVWIMAPSS